MSTSRWPFVLVLICVCTLLVSGQDDDPLKIDTSLVRLNVGVVDQRGRSITDLDRSNFKIFEDGVKQEITRFEPSTAPFSVVMILDMSGWTLPMGKVMK